MTWVIAHRGASWEEKENTLPAFERAIALGVDFIELDVQMSGDGRPVVFHDVELSRLTPLTGPVRRRRAQELAEVGIPELDDVLELTRGRIGLMVELKNAHLHRALPFVERSVANLSSEDVVISFQRRALLAARRERPDLRLLQHVGLGVSIRAAAKYAWGAGFWDTRVTAAGLARARSLGLVTTVYTVNDARRMRRLAALGVDGIFTDRPDLALESLSPRRPPPPPRSPRRRRPG